jgi:bacterioferritin (cytochrome b1)
MHVHDYLQLVLNSEQQTSEAFKKVANHHKEEPDIYFTCQMLASWSEKHAEALNPFNKKYIKKAGNTKEPERLSQTLFKEPRKGPIALLRDLHDLWLLTKEIDISYKVLLQAAKALRDTELQRLLEEQSEETKRQSDWLQTRIKQAAPQILVVAE